MVKRTFSILAATIVVLGVAFLEKGNAQTSIGVVRVVERKLPKAEVMATGIGYPPRRGLSLAQKRLLAQRAATVDAYRVLAGTLSNISGCVVEGSGYIQVSGYIKGASVTQVREYADGKVEVDLTVPVNLRGRAIRGKTVWDRTIADINKRGYPIYYLKQPKEQISEEEWLEIIKKEG